MAKNQATHQNLVAMIACIQFSGSEPPYAGKSLVLRCLCTVSLGFWSSFSIYIPREASPGCIRIRRGFSQSSKIPAQPHQHLILILRLCLCRKPHPPPLLIFQLGNVLSAVPACCTITGSQFFNMKLIELRSRDTCTMSGTTIVPHLLL